MDNDLNQLAVATHPAPFPSNDSTKAEPGGFQLRDVEGRPIFDHASLPPDAFVKVGGKTYIKTASLDCFSKGKKSSKIWDYGFEVVAMSTRERYWVCTKCKQLLFTHFHLI